MHAAHLMPSTWSWNKIASHVCWVALVVLGGACGSTDSTTGDPRPDGSVGGGADSGIDPATNTHQPYNVTFRLENPSNASVFIWRGCLGLRYRLTEVTDSTDVSPQYVCACACNQPSCRSNPMCGQCANDEVVELRPGESEDVSWIAQTTLVEQRVGYSCAANTFLPAGPYQITLAVYDSAEAAAAQGASRQVILDFNLPVTRNPLSIHLAPCGDPAVLARWPVCTAATNQTDCESAGGSWSGIRGRGFCACPTGQESCACTSSQHCLDWCIPDQAGSSDSPAACHSALEGRCTGEITFQCLCRFNEPDQSPMMVCVD